MLGDPIKSLRYEGPFELYLFDASPSGNSSGDFCLGIGPIVPGFTFLGSRTGRFRPSPSSSSKDGSVTSLPLRGDFAGCGLSLTE